MTYEEFLELIQTVDIPELPHLGTPSGDHQLEVSTPAGNFKMSLSALASYLNTGDARNYNIKRITNDRQPPSTSETPGLKFGATARVTYPDGWVQYYNYPVDAWEIEDEGDSDGETYEFFERTGSYVEERPTNLEFPDPQSGDKADIKFNEDETVASWLFVGATWTLFKVYTPGVSSQLEITESEGAFTFSLGDDNYVIDTNGSPAGDSCCCEEFGFKTPNSTDNVWLFNLNDPPVLDVDDNYDNRLHHIMNTFTTNDRVLISGFTKADGTTLMDDGEYRIKFKNHTPNLFGGNIVKLSFGDGVNATRIIIDENTPKTDLWFDIIAHGGVNALAHELWFELTPGAYNTSSEWGINNFEVETRACHPPQQDLTPYSTTEEVEEMIESACEFFDHHVPSPTQNTWSFINSETPTLSNTTGVDNKISVIFTEPSFVDGTLVTGFKRKGGLDMLNQERYTVKFKLSLVNLPMGGKATLWLGTGSEAVPITITENTPLNVELCTEIVTDFDGGPLGNMYFVADDLVDGSYQVDFYDFQIGPKGCAPCNSLNLVNVINDQSNGAPKSLQDLINDNIASLNSGADAFFAIFPSAEIDDNGQVFAISAADNGESVYIGAGFGLSFLKGDDKIVLHGPAGSFKGIVGAEDYTANLVDNSLTPKKYVDQAIAAASFGGTGSGDEYAHVVRVNATQDIKPTSLEFDNPEDGDDCWIVLSDGVREVWEYIVDDWAKVDSLQGSVPASVNLFDPIKSILEQAALGQKEVHYFFVHDSTRDGDGRFGNYAQMFLSQINVTTHNYATSNATLSNFMNDTINKNKTHMFVVIDAILANNDQAEIIVAEGFGINDAVSSAVAYQAELEAFGTAMEGHGITNYYYLAPNYINDGAKNATLNTAYTAAAATKNKGVIITSDMMKVGHPTAGNGEFYGFNFDEVVDTVHPNEIGWLRIMYYEFSHFASPLLFAKLLVFKEFANPSFGHYEVNIGEFESGSYHIGTSAEIVNANELRINLTNSDVQNQTIMIYYERTGTGLPEIMFLKNGVQVGSRVFGLDVGSDRFKYGVPLGIDEVRANLVDADLSYTNPPKIFCKINASLESTEVNFINKFNDIRNYHKQEGAVATLVTTTPTTPTPTPPSAPSGLTISEITATSMRLTWVDNSSNEEGFAIEQSLDGSTGWTLIHTTAADILTYVVSGLSSEMAYHYRVKAANAANGDSSYSNVATDKTTAASSGGGAGTVPGDGTLTWDDKTTGLMGVTTGVGTVQPDNPTNTGVEKRASFQVAAANQDCEIELVVDFSVLPATGTANQMSPVFYVGVTGDFSAFSATDLFAFELAFRYNGNYQAYGPGFSPNNNVGTSAIDGDVLKLKRVGSVWTLLRNGTTIHTFASTYTGVVECGFFMKNMGWRLVNKSVS